ncbi:carboxylesterase/lipase family protein [Paraburkholderia sp. BCC1885]|uniref:carboxylesterase/lipase family protein n=1 Tax=Paraburkholderia sp. BCC1885 TaxID=2562669 RepID=UPI001183BF07|nr:carboxylesterase family protein [Paraburkholderia sp. BCC1885]
MIKAIRTVVVIAFAMLSLDAFAAPLVQTQSGELSGASDGPVLAFKGIPYAAAPVGALRWRPPAAPVSWQGVRDATKFGASCEQPRRNSTAVIPWTAEYLADPPFSEDCLFLNVWTPTLHPASKLPVVVWIHGGGFTEGSGAVPIYRGNHLAQKGIVVVTINYRMGLFGFLASGLLDAEQGSSGEYGMMDQVAALEWVKANIAGFGGDPAQVTIEGQSAGAIAVHHLLAAPSAQGLFARAIAESNSWADTALVPRERAEAIGDKLASLSGATTLDALRAMPADQLLALQTDARLGDHVRFFPVDDGKFIPAGMKERTDVPVLLGSNHDEASAFSPTWQIATSRAYQAMLGDRFAPLSAQFAALYPVKTDADVSTTVRRLLADSASAGVIAWSQARDEHAAPAYGYRFTHPEPGPLAARFATFHSSEVPYAFGTLEYGHRPFTAKDHAISRQLQSYWSNFIRTGNPNGPGLMTWPQLDSGNFMQLGDTQAVTPLLSKEQRDAFRDWLAAGGRIGLF